MGIRNSSLAPMLCELFYRDESGSVDKQGRHAACCKLNLIGGLKAANGREFSQAFGTATDDGLYDRFLFEEVPPDWDFDDSWEIDRDGTEIPFRMPGRSHMPWLVFELKKKWVLAKPGRNRRLGELALRLALVWASANHDDEVTEGCIAAALHYAERQERIRERLTVGSAQTLDAECWTAVEQLVEQELAGLEGKSWVKKDDKGKKAYVHFRTLCQKHHLHREYGRMVGQAKKAMLDERVLIPLVVEDGDGKKKKDEQWVRLSKRVV
jgi:hypothetical protein